MPKTKAKPDSTAIPEAKLTRYRIVETDFDFDAQAQIDGLVEKGYRIVTFRTHAAWVESEETFKHTYTVLMERV